MIIIYDFDGTLTPYSLPQYKILRQCGYTDELLMKRIREKMVSENNSNLYEMYYKEYLKILSEKNIAITDKNICLGADTAKFNNGVEEYFEKFQNLKTGVKHYIITSGLKDYVCNTVISKYINGVYGVTLKKKDGIYVDIDNLMPAEEKVEAIKNIQKKNNNTNQIIYFGDGLTDKFAFEYVHSIGGENVFICVNDNSEVIYRSLNIYGIINQYFFADFSKNSKIYNYIQSKIL